MTARLLQDRDGVELKATADLAGAKREFVRLVPLGSLDRLGAAVIAKEFARDARKALASTAAPGARRTRWGRT